MKLSKDDRGIAHFVLVLLAVAVIAAIAFAGYRVMNNGGAGSKTATSESKQVAVPDQIKTRADLTQADKALDTMPIDNGVNPDSLNNDLNALK